MAIHASERRRNVLRTIAVALASANLGGAVLVPDGDERGPGADVAKWARLSVEDVASGYAGRIGSARATREDLLVVVDCFVKGAQFEAVATVDNVDDVAESVAHALRYLDLPLVDYVSDPSGATPVSGVAIRFIRPPRVVRLDPSDGYQRRMVQAQATYFSRHTG